MSKKKKKSRIDVGLARSHGFFKIKYITYYKDSNEYTYRIVASTNMCYINFDLKVDQTLRF